MKNLTVSLPLAKKMKELGWDKQTVFSEKEYGGPVFNALEGTIGPEILEEIWLPSAQEILDELPLYITDKDGLTRYFEMSMGVNKERQCGYPFYIMFEDETTLAEALGQLWIRCKERGYIDDPLCEKCNNYPELCVCCDKCGGTRCVCDKVLPTNNTDD